jgi:hypothetical protein
MIAQLLFIMRSGDVEKTAEKIYDLVPYSSEVLDKKENYRNSVFIRMLELIPENEFSYYDVLTKSGNYLKKLENVRTRDDIYNYPEVYPLQTVWSEILTILKSEKQYVHYRFYNL